MLALKSICPRCRCEVDIGLSVDAQTIATCGDLRVLVLCDDCREYHRVLVRDLYQDAFLEAAA